MSVTSTSATVPSGAGDLGRLPAELRLMIYGHVLRRNTFVLGSSSHAWGPMNEPDMDPEAEPWRPIFTDGPALLATCRQVHAEATPVFFECNVVKFMCPGLDELQRFPRLSSLRHISIHFDEVHYSEKPATLDDNEHIPNLVRDLFSAVRAFAPGATSLESIRAIETFSALLGVLQLFGASVTENLEEPRLFWDWDMEIFLEETGVATVEEFLKKIFGRNVGWLDDYLIWSLNPGLRLSKAACASAGYKWDPELDAIFETEWQTKILGD